MSALNKLSQEVKRLLWASFILSWAIFFVSLRLWGAASLWLDPSGSFFTALYSLVLLARLRGQQQKEVTDSTSFASPTSSRESILCAMYLAFYFTAGLLIIIIMIWKIPAHGKSAIPTMLIEGTLVAAEIAILTTLVCKCIRGRRIMGIPDLYRLPCHPSRQ